MFEDLRQQFRRYAMRERQRRFATVNKLSMGQALHTKVFEFAPGRLDFNVDRGYYLCVCADLGLDGSDIRGCEVSTEQ
jgi:hypothetical protein